MLREDFGCQVTPDDVITVANSGYDEEMVYVTASETNEAGVMTHHIGFFLSPDDALRLGMRLVAEAISKRKPTKKRWFNRG